MNLGRFHAGDSIPLSVPVENASGTPTLPDSAPVARIYRAGTLIETVSLPICDRYKTTAYFQKRHRLSASYTASAAYIIVYQFAISSTTYRRVSWFSVYAGGDEDGTVIAAAAVERPEANIVLYETESGKLMAGRNPS